MDGVDPEHRCELVELGFFQVVVMMVGDRDHEKLVQSWAGWHSRSHRWRSVFCRYML